MAKIKVWIVTASHGRKTPTRDLPGELQVLFVDSEKYEIPEVFAEGGRRIDRGIVKMVTKRMNIEAPQKIVVVILLGDNNLRKNEDPNFVLKHFRRILNHIQSMENARVKVVMCTLIPSYGKDSKLKNVFKEMNELIVEEAKKYSFASSILLTKKLAKHGDVNPAFYADDVHLNNEGSKLVAKAIFQHLNYLPKF